MTVQSLRAAIVSKTVAMAPNFDGQTVAVGFGGTAFATAVITNPNVQAVSSIALKALPALLPKIAVAGVAVVVVGFGIYGAGSICYQVLFGSKLKSAVNQEEKTGALLKEIGQENEVMRDESREDVEEAMRLRPRIGQVSNDYSRLIKDLNNCLIKV